jgi:polar amino acid transport system substrate-binding protein
LDNNAKNTDITSHLPQSLPGVDLENALKRVAGQSALLVRLLILFSTEHDTDAQQLRQAIADDNQEQQKALIHTLKGVSGNLGMIPLQEAVSAYEINTSKAALILIEERLLEVVEGVKTNLL